MSNLGKIDILYETIPDSSFAPGKRNLYLRVNDRVIWLASVIWSLDPDEHSTPAEYADYQFWSEWAEKIQDLSKTEITPTEDIGGV